MIYHVQAYAKDKRYGRALNNHIKLLPDDCWVCVRDLDSQFLLPDQPDLMYEAIEDHPECDLFTCATNRVWGRPLNNNSDIKYHIQEAQRRLTGSKYSHVSGVVPAFFWLFPHRVWRELPFDDHPIIHGRQSFDARWSRQIKRKMRIERLYIFHAYRIDKDRADYSHLK